MENELHKLQHYCKTTKIGNSQWGTLIVPVVKPNGNVRLYADYDCWQTHTHKKYPTPWIEDIFTKIKEGTFFCKSYISNAYLHHSMDEESADIQRYKQ